MPELPEVETISKDLNKKITGLKIRDFWTDWRKSLKLPKNIEQFKKEIKNRKILKVYRKGKNILINLTGNKLLLIHQKLTGHLLIGKWKVENEKGRVVSLIKGSLAEKVNSYIHSIFYLDNGWQLALSDLRKFAKLMVGDKKIIENLADLKNLGPDPLEITFLQFKEILKRKRGKIKSVLMDQTVLAGIGNIYSDEILWFSKINPFKMSEKLSEEELKKIYKYSRSTLKKAISLRGTSISDYRDPEGYAGGYDKIRKVYQRGNKPCFRCHNLIKRVKIGSRSAHFCPVCQSN
ncbi:MAG: DNA-formamidopyrimidine glycosylase [Patescibacteria group bacterium]